MNLPLHQDHQTFLDRIEQGLSKTVDLSKVPEWICTNTRNPRKKEFRWSFAEHEFQIEIAACASANLAARKCSQVGLSELSIRIALAIGFMRDYTAIYVLPTSKFANKFSKGRIDPVVNASPTLEPRKNKTAYSMDLKQIGGMILYVAGAGTDSDAISIPAQLLVRDEYDFGSQAVLSNFDSRLGHNKEGESFCRDFSTPTVSNFGIDRKFVAGTQEWYGVLHDACGQWVTPKFLDDVVIPGFDGVARDFEKFHLESEKYDVNGAHVLCPHCRREITIANLADPRKRKWIATFPNREDRSFQVQPFDVVTINSPARTIKQLGGYSLRKDWINFKLGDVHEDASNSFNPGLVDKYLHGPPITIYPDQPQYMQLVMGVDVGMTSWVVIGKRVGGRLRVLHLERILSGPSQPDGLFQRVDFLMQNLGVRFCVIDSMPDFNTASRLCAKYPGRMLACEYGEKLPTPLETMILKEDKMIVRVHRNKRFDLLVSAYSNGDILWCNHPELETVKEHLQGMKKTRFASEDSVDEGADDMQETWQKTGDDHYLHALNYAYIADELTGKINQSDAPPCLPIPGKVNIGPKPEPEIRRVSNYTATRGLIR